MHSSIAGSGSLHIWLLGGFRIAIDNRVVDDSAWRLRKAQSLIKFLALAHGHRLHTEQVVDIFWPDLDPYSAANNLRQVIHSARRALDPPREPRSTTTSTIQLHHDVIQLNSERELWIDVQAFELAVQTAGQSHDVQDYEHALQLYAGDLLPDDRYEDWITNQRVALRGMFQTLLLDLSRLHQERGRPDLAITTLQRLLLSDPSHEDAHALLMRLYASAGLRHQALAQFDALQTELRDQLGTSPTPATTELRRKILDGSFDGTSGKRSPQPAIGERDDVEIRTHITSRAPPKGRTKLRTNLPAELTSLIGREREIKELRDILSTSRLVTLTGPGGIGKTRLAHAVARVMLDAFPDGVYVVSLSSIRDPEFVPSAIARVLGERETGRLSLIDTLRVKLKNSRILLVLDNFEYVANAGPIVIELLEGCPHLTALITSRVRLRLRGESEYPVAPLAIPNPDELSTADDLDSYPAPMLFIQRSREIRPDFQITPENSLAIVEICRRLDGLPLAIELVATRSKVLAPEAMLKRLDRLLALLSGGARDLPERQQTMRQTIAWSYDLLNAEEQRLFRRLSVFVGGWTLTAAEAVARSRKQPSIDVLRALEALVDHSLVHQREVSGELRFSMLETIREFAHEQLTKSGEAEAIRRRHAGYFRNLVERAEPALFGADEALWLDRLHLEIDNLRAALAWGLERDGNTEIGSHLAAALWLFWDMRGHFNEGRRWMTELLSKVPTGSGVHAKLLFGAGYLATRQGDPAAAHPLLEQAIDIYQKIGDRSGSGQVLSMLGVLASFEGDEARSRELLEEALALFRQVDDQLGIARTLLDLGDLVRIQGDYPLARLLLQESLRHFRILGFQRGAAWALANLGNIARAERDFQRARELLEESRSIFQSIDDKRGLARPILYLANVARIGGDDLRACRLLAESLTLLREIRDQWRLPLWLYYVGLVAIQERDLVRGVHLLAAAEASHEHFTALLDPSERSDGDGALRRSRARLGEEAFAKAWTSGLQLALDQAVAEGMAVIRQTEVDVPQAQEPPAILSFGTAPQT